MNPEISRRLWTVFEPYHAVVYFAPEALEAYKRIGLRGYWMGYFASRAAPLGSVPASVVTAAFYNFAPRMVERALPDAWSFSSPECVLEARHDAADRALRRLLGDAIDSLALEEAATMARTAAESCPIHGRPLFAAYTALPWPDSPHMVLWHAATLLREFRGDGHVAALLHAGLDGCGAHVMLAASGNVPRGLLQPNRGWTDVEWEAAHGRLVDRGWLDVNGRLTDAGESGRTAVEAETDRLALAPFECLDADVTERFYTLMRPLAREIVRLGGIPMPNPMGVPEP